MRIDDDERRSRLGHRHLLRPRRRVDDPVEVARALVGLHGTDPASVHLSAWARLRDPDGVSAMERALYDDRSLVRMMGMRRTMFVVPAEAVVVLQRACGDAIAAAERRRVARWLSDNGISGDAAVWLRDMEEAALATLKRRGEALTSEMTGDDPRFGHQLVLARGKSYEGRISAITRAMLLLSMESRIVRGRPRGSWISSQYRWSPIERWLPAGMPEMTAAEAQVELIRQWLRAFGPGTLNDLRWWTGLTVGAVRAALAKLDTVEVELDGGERGLVLADDLDPSPRGSPWAALLPALDATIMGWAGRDWFLGEHRGALFDTNGNAGPTVWWDGRVVGGWGQRPDAEVVVRLLSDVGAEATAAITARAAELTSWMAGVRVTPRFRTPLERELSA